MSRGYNCMSNLSIDIDKRVKGLRGSFKHRWLGIHRQEVLAYYHTNGPDATMIRFNMKEYTLKNFFGRSEEYKSTRLTRLDKTEYRVEEALQGVRDNRGKISDIERRLERLTPAMSVTMALVAAVKQLMSPEDLLTLSEVGKTDTHGYNRNVTSTDENILDAPSNLRGSQATDTSKAADKGVKGNSLDDKL